VRDVQSQHDVVVGGFVSDSSGRVVLTSVIDNLLKGAATQCMQNINIMQGYDEYASIPIRQS
jgi:N-acetyl-gamma-glutamyl-phosphate reductase/acetylglutamate kinase